MTEDIAHNLQLPPLAERLRPKILADFVGQEHLLGLKGTISTLLQNNHLPSFILWGPPGVGKTTLALIISELQNRNFYQLSAINTGVKDLRSIIEKLENDKKFYSQTHSPIVFIDEIHRFNKTQQDALLGAVEKGLFILIGATTENPSFEVNKALLSRCQVYILNALTSENLHAIVHKAIISDSVLKNKNIIIESTKRLIELSGGDARKLLNALEITVYQSSDPNKIVINDTTVSEAVKNNLSMYDKNGELHYDIISAFIKSVRASDPNAAIYYLASMIEGGEDPLFICRRMIILASEDIGLANPNALLMANSCFQSVHQIGLPEGRIVMAQTAIYLACSPKSNSAYLAIQQAQAYIRQYGLQPVPLHLRNAPSILMKNIGYGKDYRYSHDFKDTKSDLECMPDELIGRTFYTPKDNIHERKYLDTIHYYWGDKYK